MPDPVEARSLPDRHKRGEFRDGSRLEDERCVGCGEGPRKHGEGYCDRCWLGSPPETVYEDWMPRDQYDQIAAENGRLRAEVETFVRALEQAQAENERLREASTVVVHRYRLIRESGWPRGLVELRDLLAELARASDETEATR